MEETKGIYNQHLPLDNRNDKIPRHKSVLEINQNEDSEVEEEKWPDNAVAIQRSSDTTQSEECDAVQGTIAINTRPNDNRLYANIKIYTMHAVLGLLDSDASISILGRNSPIIINSNSLRKPAKIQSIKTANGTIHSIIAEVELPPTFNGKKRKIKYQVVPGITREIILGTNFWQAFGIVPHIPETCWIAGARNEIKEEINIEEQETKIARNSRDYQELSHAKQRKLKEAGNYFQYAQTEYLTHTPLIQHHIDTGTAKPIRQKMYHVSPYIQEKINEEIDRIYH